MRVRPAGIVRLLAGLAGLAAFAGPDRAALGAVDPGVAVAPRMEFAPPAAGTYALEKIQTVADATLFDPASRPTQLKAVTTSKITLLTFFYTYCPDPLGCPFAYHALTEIRGVLLHDAALAADVRFVDISLDPTTDTPEAIARYRDMATRGSSFEWRFLTAGSVRDLLPVLDDFGQDVSVEKAADGSARRTLHHMLKLFLIDSDGNVREIYTLAYLHPAVIVNDIRTLWLGQDGGTSRVSVRQ
jgi:cytochrome oxidase Cu insertion factor (SCO1/SenC/PrrC family)